MSIIEDKDRAERKAKKLVIQSRGAAKKRRAKLKGKWLEVSGNEFSFLDLETSLAVWTDSQRRRVAAHPEEVASTVSEASSSLEQFSKFLSEIEIVHGFCFAYGWERTGAFIINVKGIADHLSELMFMFEDELEFYSHDFTRAFALSGDRTGTGENLNSLSVGVKGADWDEKWEKGQNSCRTR